MVSEQSTFIDTFRDFSRGYIDHRGGNKGGLWGLEPPPRDLVRLGGAKMLKKRKKGGEKRVEKRSSFNKKSSLRPFVV